MLGRLWSSSDRTTGPAPASPVVLVALDHTPQDQGETTVIFGRGTIRPHSFQGPGSDHLPRTTGWLAPVTPGQCGGVAEERLVGQDGEGHRLAGRRRDAEVFGARTGTGATAFSIRSSSTGLPDPAPGHDHLAAGVGHERSSARAIERAVNSVRVAIRSASYPPCDCGGAGEESVAVHLESGRFGRRPCEERVVREEALEQRAR